MMNNSFLTETLFPSPRGKEACRNMMATACDTPAPDIKFEKFERRSTILEVIEKLSIQPEVKDAKDRIGDVLNKSSPAGSALSPSSSIGSNLNKVSVINWAETFEARLDQFHYPKTVEEVVHLVKTHDKIRCAGAMHSCAPLVASEGIIMSLTKLDKIMDINPETRIITCQSGVPIHDMCDALKPYNLALGALGTIDWQTISGAVMTGTHGGALSIPSLHEFVRSYTLVKPDGSIVKVSKSSEPDLFSAMAPSMGVFGAVVEMEVEAVPFQILEARMRTVPMEDVIELFEPVMQENKYARLVVYPSIRTATIWTANPVDSREEAVANGAVDYDGYINFRNDQEKSWLEKFLVLCNKKEYFFADAILDQVVQSQLSRLGHYCGQYNHVLCKERNNGIPHADIEFAFDFKKNKEVLRTVQHYCDNNRIPYYNYEMRTTAQDNAILSCCQGRDSMWIDFQALADVSRDFFDHIESVVKPIGFRKHWAKGMDNTDPLYVVNQFPRIKEFVSLMKSFDPNGKFRNTQGESWFKVMDDILT